MSSFRDLWSRLISIFTDYSFILQKFTNFLAFCFDAPKYAKLSKCNDSDGASRDNVIRLKIPLKTNLNRLFWTSMADLLCLLVWRIAWWSLKVVGCLIRNFNQVRAALRAGVVGVKL